MSTYDEILDGAWTLAEQQSTLNYSEGANHAHCIGYIKAASVGTTTRNRATFDELPVTEKIRPLTLVALPKADPLAKLLAAHPDKTIAFASYVFVAGVETHVIGLRDA